MDETQSKATFVALSQALTGIPGSMLAPLLDPTKILDTVYNAFVTNADPCAAQLILESFQALRSKGLSDDEIAAAIIADPATGPLAASIMKLWLLGNWYPPSGSATPTVVSSNAYIEGWVWKIMQAHPMGYSMLEYGYWAEPPPPLSAILPPRDETVPQSSRS